LLFWSQDILVGIVPEMFFKQGYYPMVFNLSMMIQASGWSEKIMELIEASLCSGK